MSACSFGVGEGGGCGLMMGSRLFVPVEENSAQHIYVVNKKEDGSVEREKVMAVRYVPLTDAPVE